MNQNEVNPKIDWCSINNKNCLKFIFKGVLTKEDAARATTRWREIFSSNNTNNINIVWHCIEMKGYEAMARSIWQNALKELKSKIACIWLITESPIIRAGAKIMSAFTSYDIKVAKSESDVEI